MSSIKESNCFVLNKAPFQKVNFNLGEDDSTFKLTKKSLRELKDGEVLIKTLILSNDPTQRAWIQKGLKADRMYVDPVLEGDIMRSSGIGQVINSKSSKYQRGDVVNCSLKWADYAILSEKLIFNKIYDTSIPLSNYLGVLGMTGLTAYFGLTQVVNLKKTDTIIISAASGATGSTCVQIAKNVIGCKKVIGISGGADKCEFVKSLGADYCIDYKKPNLFKNLKEALGDDKYCDVFFDGVGGKILDNVLNLVKPFGTIIACGSISGYNDVLQSRVLNWGQIITNRLTVKGFIILDYESQYEKGVKDLATWIKQGKIKTDDSTFTLIDLTKKEDFTKIPESWGILFSDQKGPGKLLTQLSKL